MVERHFWRDDDGLVVDVWDRRWRELEPYRGLNANMHMVEALLAAADVTGAAIWRRRAARVTERVVHGWARQNRWRPPEHYDETWRPVLDYNTGERAHPFRPYGVTIGTCWNGRASPCTWALRSETRHPPGLCPTRHLCSTGLWTTDGPQTAPRGSSTPWTSTARRSSAAACTGSSRKGSPPARRCTASRVRLASATRTTRGGKYTRRSVVDAEHGSWHHELDPSNHPASTVWQGKPDVYHAVQATLVPMLPLAPSFATALRAPSDFLTTQPEAP